MTKSRKILYASVVIVTILIVAYLLFNGGSFIEGVTKGVNDLS